MTETNAERLESIRDYHEIKINENEFHTVRFLDAEWLIEQAERAQQLEKAIEQKLVTVQTKHYVYGGPDDSVSYNLLKENDRLREALEFYADETTYDNVVYDDWGILEGNLVEMDCGHRARQALEGDSK